MQLKKYRNKSFISYFSMLSCNENEFKASANSMTIISNVIGHMPAPYIYGIINNKYGRIYPKFAMKYTFFSMFFCLIFLIFGMIFKYSVHDDINDEKESEIKE